jgi:hypothetical protein
MDLATAQQHLDAWLAVDLALTAGQAYTLPNGVSVSRVDPRSVSQRITYWRSVVDAYTVAASGGASRTALASFGT